jgi:peptide/nickel transport system substrate-binding protein
MLDAEAQRKLYRHLAQCEQCRAYAAELEALEARLAQSLQARWPSPGKNDFKKRQTSALVQDRVRKKRRVQRFYHSSQAVAWVSLAVALALAVGWLFHSIALQPASTPSDAVRPELTAITIPRSPTPSSSSTLTPTSTPQALLEKVTPTPPPGQKESTLTVCQAQEPDTLYFYAAHSMASINVLEAIYDGPIDTRSFDYQPIILEKLPSLSDGDAITRQVTVTAGDLVVNDAGELVVLQAGTRVRPVGCYSHSCAVDFDSAELLKMEQMVVTFKLKAGLLWSDGEPLTAYDSLYSFKLTQDPDTPGDKADVKHTARYQVVDDYTTIWTGIPGYLTPQYMVQFWTPLPEHAWGEMTAQELLKAPESSRQPIGWGPFVIQEWVRGEHIVLTRNENYWRSDEGLPRLDQVIYRFVDGNANANISALLAGECDVVDQTTSLTDRSDLLLEFQAVGQLNASFVTSTIWEHVDLGVASAEDYEQPNVLGDARVRQALAYCMDRQAIIEKVMYGQSLVLDSYLPSEHPLFNPDVAHYDFDVKKGSALLKKAGWIDKDQDPETPRVAQGVEGVPDGTLLSLELATTSASQRQATARIIRDSLAQCGVRVNLVFTGADDLFANGPEGPVFGRRFDLAQYAWMVDVEPPCNLYLCSQVPDEENGWAGVNAPGFCDAEYDAACTTALQSLPGMTSYEQAHQQAQRIFAQQLPSIPLYPHLKVAISRPDLRGMIMDPTARSEFWNIEEFYIED